ncbi:MAG: metallopeptidase TldD-related protein [Acidobacteria bacterium]|nr:metallopeptidase TldD-related protein [Acidobacteriota bacterium]
MPDRRTSGPGTPHRQPRRRRPGRSEAEPRLSSLDRVQEELAAAVERSPADETEILWLESRRGRTGYRVPDLDSYRRRSRQATFRVREGRRPGLHRTGGVRTGELDGAVRHALAAARGALPELLPPLPEGNEAEASPAAVSDPDLERLHAKAARQLLQEALEDDEAAIIEWTVGQVAIANSRELARGERASAVMVEVRSGVDPGAGFARHAARSLDGLQLNQLVETARERRASEGVAKTPPRGAPVLLAPEATIELVELLNLHAFSSRSILEGESFLLQHTGVQVFDRRLDLADDACLESGLPFPFDLEGTSKVPVELVSAGVPKTPALDTATAARVGLTPTCHCTGGEEAYPLNMFLRPGEHSEEDLFRSADGGVWVSRLDEVECFDPGRMRVRARARGVRRLRGGRLAEPVIDLVWEDSLLRVFSNLLAIGAACSCRPSRDGFLGGTSAPALAVADVDGLTAA